MIHFQAFKNAMYYWLLLSKCLLDIFWARQLVRKDKANTISISVQWMVGVQRVKKCATFFE